MPQVIVSSDSDSDDGHPSPTAPQKAKARRKHDEVPGNETPPPRTRKPSQKVAVMDKENLEVTKKRLEAQEKAVLKLRKKVNTMAAAVPLQDNNDPDDDGPESEERDFDGPNTAFMSSVITPLPRLPVPQRVVAPMRKVKKSKANEASTISSRAFKNLPELSPDQRFNVNGNPPLSPTADEPNTLIDGGGDGDDHELMLTPCATGDKRPHPGSELSPALPAKRSRPKSKQPLFREGFVAVAGAKPKAGDYAPIEEAIILRACAEYSSRALALGSFPGTSVQYQWAEECFNNACRSSNERYKSTDRVIKLITKRGSAIRGKVVDSFRPLFATHYKFQRGTSKAIIAANKDRATTLLKKAAFHYKDTETRKGYAENAIIPAARTQIIFKDKKSLAAIFPSYFNPIPAPYLALEFSVLQFLTQEWSTGTHVPGAFTEKEMGNSYHTHLSDINEKWIKYNPVVTENLRRKWYKRASQHFAPAEPEKGTHIEEEDEDALRLELAGRTGETDSEGEDGNKDEGEGRG
ncbi:hypothetical protein B0H14DRAFT_43470 [Mycena olivaceomarginata]|nr:hypothetical protein B0H14DRAFT_43470 [Mycena olivaceomarginata]